jgi:hypothetical protein
VSLLAVPQTRLCRRIACQIQGPAAQPVASSRLDALRPSAPSGHPRLVESPPHRSLGPPGLLAQLAQGLPRWYSRATNSISCRL